MYKCAFVVERNSILFYMSNNDFISDTQKIFYLAAIYFKEICISIYK